MKRYKRILICGLPGSGKTTLARHLAYNFLVPHHNADTIRELTGNWDFTTWGRYQQYEYMRNQWGILDFVCPKQHFRNGMRYDLSIWMNTIKESKYEDTNEMFEPFNNADIIVTKFPKLENNISYKPGYEEMLKYLNNINL